MSQKTAKAAANALSALVAHLNANPLDGIAWLPGQMQWLSDDGAQPVLYRAGVRSGKSLAACAEVIWRCLGSHPFKEIPPAPVRIAFITTSKGAQGVQIQRLFWEMVCKEDLVDEIEFSERTGFRGHVPVVQFKNGSSVTWYSNSAGPRALQGSEYSYIQIDEPCSRELFDEANNRVRNTGGKVGITMTPLHLPVPWLKDLCEKGLVTDVHTPLTPEGQISPMTGLPRTTKTGVPWDQKFISHLRATVIGPDAAPTLDGEWESRSEGQFFSCFDKLVHVSDTYPTREMDFHIGFDYAASDRDMGMCAVLTGSYKETTNGETYTHFYILAEVGLPGTSSMDHFAAGILEMLARFGLDWHDLDSAYGDIPAKSRHQIASNVELARAVGRQIGVRTIRPKILNVKEGASAGGATRRTVDIRTRWMFQEVATNRVSIHESCTAVIAGMEGWDYSSKSEHKDILDALHYGLRDFWTTRRRSTKSFDFRIG